jgi:hypothetical protein
MYNINLCIKTLKKWAVQEQLIQKTIDTFWNRFLEFNKKSPNPYNDNLISLYEYVIALRKKVDNNFDYCCVSVDISYNDRDVGYYDAYFTLKGELYDDELFFG